jgi:hypothetical protein
MYLQYFGDEYRICDSLSPRAHYSNERPVVSSSSLLSPSRTANAFLLESAPSLGLQPTSAALQQRSFSTPLFYALGRRTPVRRVSGTLVLQRCRLHSKQRWHPQRGDKLDLALSGAAATLASSSFAHTFTCRSRPLNRSDRAFPVTPVFERLSSQM